MKSSPSERKKYILEILKKQDFVKIDSLAQKFSTSEITIRRDLDKLDSEGLLTRTFGGAEKKNIAFEELFYDGRIKVMEDKKMRIGLFAASLIKSPDVVFLNPGTTTLHVAKALKNKKGITIVTNSIPVFIELRFAQDIELILLGGSYRPVISAFSGPITEQSMKNISAKYAFLGTDGISRQNGVTSNDFHASQIIRNMIRASENTILVADHTKFGKSGPFKYANISEFNSIIVDDGISEENLAPYKRDGLVIHRV